MVIISARELIQYTAIGVIKAKYSPCADKLYRGIFQVGDDVISGSLNHALSKYLNKNPSEIDSTNIWRVYPKSPKSYSKLNFEAIALIDNLECVANRFLIRGELYKWDNLKETFVIKVERNIPTPKRLKDSHLFCPSFLEIVGKLPSPPKRGQFWEALCILDNKKLLLNKAIMLGDGYSGSRDSTIFYGRSNLLLDRFNQMTLARAEITLKFTTIPKVRCADNKRVEFDLATDKGVVFTVNIKAKSWRSALKKMEEMDDWIAVVKGKLGQPCERGFFLAEAGLQVFEILPKQDENC